MRCHDQSDGVGSVKKTKQDNDMTDYIDLVYVETEIKLSGPISMDVVCAENLTG